MDYPDAPKGSQNRPWQVETNGINKVTEEERIGKLSDLFWIWFGANIGILAVVYGAIILSFGMNFLQGVLIILSGTASFFLVGAFSVAGRNGGAPMMTLSRKVFGIYGNILPNAVSWVSLVGWETISVITGTYALAALFSMVWPGSFMAVVIASIILMVGSTIVAGLLGQATLVVIQTWASYIFGALTILVIVLLVPQTHWDMVLSRPLGPWLGGFLPALTIIIAGTGLSWANAAADYSRYMPHSTRGTSIVWTTTLGGGIPLVVLMLTGFLLATQVPSLATTTNPIQVIRDALPRWAAIPYLITAAGGLIVEGDLSLYSSGLNLLNMFVPLTRYKTVVVDAVIMIVGTVYVVLIAQNFFGPFESFVVLLGVGLAAWAGVFLVDQVIMSRHNANDYSPSLLYPGTSATPIPGVKWPAVIAWIIGVMVGLLFTTSPFFNGPLAHGIFASSSLEVLFAFLAGGLMFLTLNRRFSSSARESDRS